MFIQSTTFFHLENCCYRVYCWFDVEFDKISHLNIQILYSHNFYIWGHFPINIHLGGSYNILWHSVLTMKKIMRKPGLGKIGENKLRHKIEITLFTEIALCWSHAYKSPQGEMELTCAADAYANWWNTEFIVCLERRHKWKFKYNMPRRKAKSTTQFSEMEDPKTLSFLKYQVNLIPGAPVISVRNKTQLILLLDIIHSLHIMRAKTSFLREWISDFLLLEKKSESAFLWTGKKMQSASNSKWS